AMIVTFSPRSMSYRLRKLDASANAPWTRTTVGSAISSHLAAFGRTVHTHRVTRGSRTPGDLVRATSSLRRSLGVRSRFADQPMVSQPANDLRKRRSDGQ